MACGQYSSFLDYWLNGQFIDAVMCPYHDTLGPLVFGLGVMAVLAIGLYAYHRSILPVAVVFVLSSAIWIQSLPSAYLRVGAIALISVVGIAGFLLHRQVKQMAQ